MECFIIMGDLDDFLHIGINAEKSTQIGEFVSIVWKDAQETFCAFSLLSILINVIHFLSFIPFAFDGLTGIFVVSGIFILGGREAACTSL